MLKVESATSEDYKDTLFCSCYAKLHFANLIVYNTVVYFAQYFAHSEYVDYIIYYRIILCCNQ